MSGPAHAPSDGCTGFQWLEGFFPTIRDCCVVHDAGGSDGTLLDCLQAGLPPWAWAAAALCVGLMIGLRPVYVVWQRWRKKDE